MLRGCSMLRGRSMLRGCSMAILLVPCIPATACACACTDTYHHSARCVEVRMKGRVVFDALLDDVDFPQKKSVVSILVSRKKPVVSSR